MKTLARQYGLVFFIGFILFVVALALGAPSGALWSPVSWLAAIRWAGITLMLTGFTLWVVFRRDEAGKPELNPLFYFFAVVAMLMALIGVLFHGVALGAVLASWSMAAAGAGVAVALIMTLVNPAFSNPVTQKWPEGGEPEPAPAHHEDHHDEEPHAKAGHEVETPAETTDESASDDLTRIEGIGPKISTLLTEAGVATFAGLAAKSAEEITTTLKDAGFKAPFNASSWPEQAELAARGDWAALDVFQGALIGGRKK